MLISVRIRAVVEDGIFCHLRGRRQPATKMKRKLPVEMAKTKWWARGRSSFPLFHHSGKISFVHAAAATKVALHRDLNVYNSLQQLAWQTHSQKKWEQGSLLEKHRRIYVYVFVVYLYIKHRKTFLSWSFMSFGLMTINVTWQIGEMENSEPNYFSVCY